MAFNLDCKRGHITSTGKEAKYIALWALSQNWAAFLIDGMVHNIDKVTGRQNDGKFCVEDKPAPKKYINLYRYKKYEYENFSDAKKFIGTPDNMAYHSTVEIDGE